MSVNALGVSRPVASLSVVVVILGGREYLIRCLQALGRQSTLPREIIVPHDETLADVFALRAEFPHVRFVAAEGRRTYAEMRALGFRQASGDIIALTEDHCVPQPRWCASVLAAHAAPHAAVGGPVDKRGADSALDWAIYLCDFGRYMCPVVEGPAQYLTDCNVSYKRAAIEPLSELWHEEFHETTVNWALLGRGESLWLSPALLVLQQRTLEFAGALRERFAFGRLFASTRVAAVSPSRRLGYAAASVALPAVLIARVVSNVVRKRRPVGQFLRALPLIALVSIVWVCGELLGYLTGSAGTLSPHAAGAPRPLEGELRRARV